MIEAVCVFILFEMFLKCLCSMQPLVRPHTPAGFAMIENKRFKTKPKASFGLGRLLGLTG